MKILIAESNEEILLHAKAKLRSIGRCDIVNNNREAFNMIKRSLINKRPYDIIFTNIGMDEVTGMTLLRLVRTYEEASDSRKKSKFILVAENSKETWLKKDRNTVVVEPFSKRNLIEAISNLEICY